MARPTFDYKVHVRDAKTGKVVKTNSYRKYVSDKGTVLERPPGSGYFYFPSGVACTDPNFYPKAYQEKIRAEKEAQEKFAATEKAQAKVEVDARLKKLDADKEAAKRLKHLNQTELKKPSLTSAKTLT